MPAGRPSDYTPAIAAELCNRMAEGLSLREVCRQDDMPSKTSVFRWLAKHEEFRVQYDKARAASVEALAEDILDIADDGTNDWMARNDEDNIGYQVNGEAIQRARLRIDARKWLLSKIAPKKYGDSVKHTGPDGGPIQTESKVIQVVGVEADENPDPETA